jgi:hypothetical protein
MSKIYWHFLTARYFFAPPGKQAIRQAFFPLNTVKLNFRKLRVMPIYPFFAF